MSNPLYYSMYYAVEFRCYDSFNGPAAHMGPCRVDLHIDSWYSHEILQNVNNLAQRLEPTRI